MPKQTIFTGTQKRVLRALYHLERWATINEIAQWADNMSWNTADSIIKKFYNKGMLSTKLINGKRHWVVREF